VSDDIFQPEDRHPHVDSGTCGKCRKPFGKGHRIIKARIAEKRGANPANLSEIGVYLFDEFEFVHADCRDPLLKKGLQDG